MNISLSLIESQSAAFAKPARVDRATTNSGRARRASGSPFPRDFRRSLPANGFGRFELVAIIVIIVAIITWIVPAIQSWREDARRRACGENLKQLALALMNYQAANRTFPCSQIYNQAGVSDYGGNRKYALSCISENQGPNWVVAVQPYLEGAGVTKLYNKEAYYLDAVANISYRSRNLPYMLCPSDGNAMTPYNASTMLSPTAKKGHWGRGCYAANAVVNDTTLGFLSALPAEQQSPWTDDRQRGVMLPNIACTLKQITDGTSKTVLLAEIRADVGRERQSGGSGLEPAEPAPFSVKAPPPKP